MGKRFKGSRATLVAALGLSETDKHILDAASAICSKTKMNLRLVHVVEPWAGPLWSIPVAGEAAISGMIQTVEEQSQMTAEQELKQLADSIKGDFEITTNVLTGRVAHGLISDAVVNKGSMILTGAAPGSHAFVPKGLSTALTLMAESPIPVMVVSQDCKVDFSRGDLKVLAADDLTDSSLSVVHVAYDLAASLGHSNVEHLHVNSLDLETLRASLSNAQAASHSVVDPAVSAESLFEMIKKDLTEKMKQRSPLHMSSLEASGGKYTYNIVNGNPSEAINNEVERTGVDVLVCGRHQTFHRKPFLIGRVPFSAMLSLGRAVVVAPPEV